VERRRQACNALRHDWLLYYHARYYNPVIARFVSADTIIPGQDDKAGTANPQGLNRYPYTNNNPVKSRAMRYTWDERRARRSSDEQTMRGNESFSRLLQQQRRARDLTQEALAQQVSCAVDTIKKLEQGLRRPSRQLAAQLADGLGLAGDARATFLAAARAVAHDPTDAPVRTTAAVDGIPAPAATPRHNNLPYQPTPFVGRTVELAALAALFADPATRLVTIVGPGGMGKTRLAIAFAERVAAAERYPDGVCFVSLAAVEAMEYVVPMLAETLNFPLDTGKQQTRSPRQQIYDYLREKRLLLILDNLEHLLGDANEGAGAADLIAARLCWPVPCARSLRLMRRRPSLGERKLYCLRQRTPPWLQT
jgi:RHS repeat-associated protein